MKDIRGYKIGEQIRLDDEDGVIVSLHQDGYVIRRLVDDFFIIVSPLDMP